MYGDSSAAQDAFAVSEASSFGLDDLLRRVGRKERSGQVQGAGFGV